MGMGLSRASSSTALSRARHELALSVSTRCAILPTPTRGTRRRCVGDTGAGAKADNRSKYTVDN